MAMFIEEPELHMITVGLLLDYTLHQLSFRPSRSWGQLKGHTVTTCAMSQIKTFEHRVFEHFLSSTLCEYRMLPQRSFVEKRKKEKHHIFFAGF